VPQLLAALGVNGAVERAASACWPAECHQQLL
jgi:hypothetical protein